MKVIILGGTGMLGSMLTDYLSKNSNLQLKVTVRSQSLLNEFSKIIPNIEWCLYDLEDNRYDLKKIIKDSSWIINATGFIKHHITDDNSECVERALRVNSLFPYTLVKEAMKYNSKILQIATDCVYSGAKGYYNETDYHDPYDVYGKTKSLGEVRGANILHLRCSLIGPEPRSTGSTRELLEWFRNQPKNAAIKGYTNHLWNGITTLQCARICHGIIMNNINIPHVHHLIPEGSITKANLLKLFAFHYDRNDITITETETPTPVNRILGTVNDTLNKNLWAHAGYTEPPTINAMMEELVRYKGERNISYE